MRRLVLRLSHAVALRPSTIRLPHIALHVLAPAMAARRRQSSTLAATAEEGSASSQGPRRRSRQQANLSTTAAEPQPPPPRRQTSRALSSRTNPNVNPDVVDGITALRSSPDAVDHSGVGEVALKPRADVANAGDTATNGSPATNATPAAANAPTADGSFDVPADAHGQQPAASSRRTRKPANAPPGKTGDTTPPASETAQPEAAGKNKRKRAAAGQHVKVDSASADGAITNATTTTGTAPLGAAVEEDVGVNVDPEGEHEGDVDDDVKEALGRPPPVNSDYLPLPWKGRIGYVRVSPCYLIFFGPSANIDRPV